MAPMHLVTLSNLASFKAHQTVHTSSALSLNRQEERKNIKGKILGKEQLKTQIHSMSKSRCLQPGKRNDTTMTEVLDRYSRDLC